MYTFEHSIYINRSPQEVHNFITNPANAPKWQSGTLSAEWASDNPVGVGSTWRSVSKLLGRKIESVNEMTSWNPPNEHRFKLQSGSIPFEATVTCEAKENGTQLTVRGQAEIGGFFKLAEGLVGKQLDKHMEADQAALKLFLEAG